MRQATVILTLIGVLLQTSILSPNCLDNATHPAATAIANGAGSAPADDGGCCSYCFCCHCPGVLTCADARVSLVANGLAPPTWNPPLPENPIGPADQPPRG